MSKTRGKQTKRLIEAPGQQLLLDLGIWLGLILSIFAVYAQVGHFDFNTYDDDVYVYNNVHVQEGLTAGSIKWAFTGVVSNNWMPVTLLSHILDGQLFQMQSGMHHLVNVLFHALAAVLLFVVLHRATRARWASAFVAFVFALHPLHVGSVAWVAERKDVLSACFFFLTLYLYVRYTERPSPGRYLLMAGAFCLGLMSKPMLVTLPFTLLLFDVWPLRRVQWPKILWEKLPLVGLSTIASVVTYMVQRETGSVRAIPLATRMENALISYAGYIGQTFWPTRLAVFYPYPKSIPAWQAVMAGAFILGVSAFAIYASRTRPYVTTGWFWYLGTLVPVIGLVQVGMQSHADRYTYIPMVGLSIILAWGAADVVNQWVAKWPRTAPAIAAAALVSCAVCMAVAWSNAAYWRNSETLYQHAIDVTRDNWVAEYNLGHYLMNTPGRTSDAIPHFEAALRIEPDDADSNNNLGACLLDKGRAADAIRYFEKVLRVKPDSADAHFNLALALSKTPGREGEAISQYEAALRVNPGHAQAHQSLALLLLKRGRTEDAVSHLEAAVRVNPDYASEYNLGVVLLTVPGRQPDAIVHLEAAQRIRPDPEVAKTLDRLRAAQK